MSDTPNPSCFGRCSQTPRIAADAIWVRWLVCTLLLVIVLPVWADEEEDKFFDLLGIIQRADALDASGQTGKALTKYQEAQALLEKFRKTYPDWNPRVIAYRTKYLAEKVAACSQKIAASAQKPTAKN